MKNIQTITDKTAISLSFICTFHCLALPVLAVSLPAITALNLDNEIFHLWMVLAVIPISLIALTIGCKKHKNLTVALLGISGLCLLIAAVFLGHAVLGEVGEKLLTVVGACLIAAGHLLNHRLCRKTKCECH
ncbi:MerC domain-containing protein [bacterium SCSIO 12696]|nr:MerC domain-containing protein [bacterium SCSIO 12696]